MVSNKGCLATWHIEVQGLGFNSQAETLLATSFHSIGGSLCVVCCDLES